MSKQTGKVVLLAETHLRCEHVQTIQFLLVRLKRYCLILALEQPIAEITREYFDGDGRAGAQEMAQQVSMFARRCGLPDPTCEEVSVDRLQEGAARFSREGILASMYLQWPYGVAVRSMIDEALRCKFRVRGFDCADEQLSVQSAQALQLDERQLMSRLRATVPLRDKFMAEKLIRLSQQGHVFATLGLAHVKGVRENLIRHGIDVCVVSANDCLVQMGGVADYALTTARGKAGFADSLSAIFNQKTHSYQIVGLKARSDLNGELVYFVRHYKNGRLIVRREAEDAKLLTIKLSNLCPLDRVSKPVRVLERVLKSVGDDADVKFKRKGCCDRFCFWS
jgi:hypothetical protein